MFKSFFANQGLGPDFSEVSAWAKRRGHEFKRERDGNGFVVDGKLEDLPWRLEWGPSQRPYIQGQELRLRMALGLPPDMQMLIVSKTLMEQLEKQAFEQFTQSNQTEMGDSTPEETRWLVMFPKIALNGSKLLRASFAGVSSLPNEGPAWVEGPLGHALERAAGTLLRLAPPFVLMTLRGKLYLRMALSSADETDVAAALALFETAGTEALRVGRSRGDEPVTWAQTTSTAWQALTPPGRKRGGS
ncbi:MAG: hypothetical protein K8R60_04200 [Burkholderiales bacterium]|nr:hypothetical protein [Burkholderiales bacterium]